MPSYRALFCLTVALLSALVASRPVTAEPPAPAYVHEETDRARQDMNRGGPRRVMAGWHACNRNARATDDPDIARHCLAYGAAAVTLMETGAAGPDRWTGRMPGRDRLEQDQSVLFDIAGVRERLRPSYVSLYQLWAARDLPGALPPVLAAAPPYDWRDQPRLVSQGERPWQTAPFEQRNQPWRPAAASAAPASPAPQRQTADSLEQDASEIPLRRNGDSMLVPVVLNDSVTLNFEVDSGASDVTISGRVLERLMRAGVITAGDFRGHAAFTLADGTNITSQTIRFRSVRVGDRVVQNVTGSVTNDDGALLLGQSFLARFRSWSIDNRRQTLVLR